MQQALHNLGFKGWIDELAVYGPNNKPPQSRWTEHYNAAFGGDVDPVSTTITVAQDVPISISRDANVDILTSYDATIGDVAITLLTDGASPTPKPIGVRITFSVTAGSGKTEVTHKFTSAFMLRNPSP